MQWSENFTHAWIEFYFNHSERVKFHSYTSEYSVFLGVVATATLLEVYLKKQ